MGLKKFSTSFQVANKSETRNLGVISHNNRRFFAKNVDQKRSADNVTYVEKDLREFYHELFDDALKSYNDKMRSNRKIVDYYEHIKNSKQERLFQEIIVGFGNAKEIGVGTDDWETAKNLCDEYIRTFEKRNPNLRVFNAVMHLDEANPHLHIDFVPIATNQSRGLSTRVSMKRALMEQGFVSAHKKDNELIAWEDSEREFMTQILHRHKLERDFKNEHRSHLSISEYKAQQEELQKIKAQTEKIKANVSAAIQKNPSDITAEEAAMIKNENVLMRKKIERQREQINELSERYQSPLIKFEIFDADKLLYVARELENRNIKFAEDNNSIYVPEFALAQCKKFAAEFKSIIPGIKEKIKMDIDVLVLSSESLEQLLDKMTALGYEIKRGKYLAVKSPDAQKFTRLKTLGEDYLPENLEKRITNRNAFPNAVYSAIENSSDIEREFHLEISKTIVAIRGLAFRPKKLREDRIYDFENDNLINELSKQILTITEFNINSREKLYAVAEELENKIAENLRRVEELKNEIPVLKKKIENDKPTEDQQRRYDLLPNYIDSLKAEIERDRRKLSRVVDVIEHYERVSGGDYLKNIIREQQADQNFARAKDLREQDGKSISAKQRTESIDTPKKS